MTIVYHVVKVPFKYTCTLSDQRREGCKL